MILTFMDLHGLLDWRSYTREKRYVDMDWMAWDHHASIMYSNDRADHDADLIRRSVRDPRLQRRCAARNSGNDEGQL
jgi:hypothetical protein